MTDRIRSNKYTIIFLDIRIFLPRAQRIDFDYSSLLMRLDSCLILQLGMEGMNSLLLVVFLPVFRPSSLTQSDKFDVMLHLISPF